MIATGMNAMSAAIATGILRLAVTALVLLTAVTMIGTMINVMMTGGLGPRHPGGILMTGGPMMIGVTAEGMTAVIPMTVEMAMEVGTVVVAGRLLQS
jgi:hypothetical protein